ncbi:hypothetical protein CUTA107171_27875 [Cupriavidus taiwanensis]
MLPFPAALHLGAVEIAVDIGGLVDVDVDVAPAPVAVAEDRARGGQADAPGKAGHQCGAGIVGGIRGPVIRRIGGIAPGAVYHRRVVGRDVDDFGIRRLDPHDGLRRRRCRCRCRRLRRLHRWRRRGFDNDLLLLVRLEIAGLLRARPQPLHRVEHFLLLADEGVAQLLRPVELVAHRLQHLRKRHQRLDADIPGLALDRLQRRVALHLGIGLDPACRLHDFERIGGGHQHLGQDGVGIEGNGRNQRLQFFRLERCRLGWRVLRMDIERQPCQARAQAGAKPAPQSHSPPLHGRLPCPVAGRLYGGSTSGLPSRHIRARPEKGSAITMSCPDKL